MDMVVSLLPAPVETAAFRDEFHIIPNRLAPDQYGIQGAFRTPGRLQGTNQLWQTVFYLDSSNPAENDSGQSIEAV